MSNSLGSTLVVPEKNIESVLTFLSVNLAKYSSSRTADDLLAATAPVGAKGLKKANLGFFEGLSSPDAIITGS